MKTTCYQKAPCIKTGNVCESRCRLLRYYWATGHNGNCCAYATLDRPFIYISLQQKLDNVAKIEKSLRQLGANDKEIEESIGQYYTQIKEEHIGRIVHYVNELLPEEEKIYKNIERDSLDLHTWSLDKIENLMMKNNIKPTGEITEAIEDYKFFEKFKRIRRENKWQG